MKPTGTEKEQFTRLDHAAAKHGLRVLTCRHCGGDGCRSCDGEGIFFTSPRLTCEDPNCELTKILRRSRARRRGAA